jgi:hypothetical protein
VQITFDNEAFRSVEMLTPEPIGLGSRFRGDFKGMGKVDYEYAAYEQDRLIEHAVQMPFGAARHRFDFEPSDGGSRLVQTMTLRPNLLGWVLWPFILRRAMRNRLRSVNGLVKQHVEA